MAVPRCHTNPCNTTYNCTYSTTTTAYGLHVVLYIQTLRRAYDCGQMRYWEVDLWPFLVAAEGQGVQLIPTSCIYRVLKQMPREMECLMQGGRRGSLRQRGRCVVVVSCVLPCALWLHLSSTRTNATRGGVSHARRVTGLAETDKALRCCLLRVALCIVVSACCLVHCCFCVLPCAGWLFCYCRRCCRCVLADCCCAYLADTCCSLGRVSSST